MTAIGMPSLDVAVLRAWSSKKLPTAVPWIEVVGGDVSARDIAMLAHLGATLVSRYAFIVGATPAELEPPGDPSVAR